jgi:hypothetical protein
MSKVTSQLSTPAQPGAVSKQIDVELEKALTRILSVAPIVDAAMKIIESWLARNERGDSFEDVVMSVHAYKLRDHSAALVERIAGLRTPLPDRSRLLSGSVRISTSSATN